MSDRVSTEKAHTTTGHAWPCPGFYVGNHNPLTIGSWACSCPRSAPRAQTPQAVVADVLAEWGVKSQHGSWTDREAQEAAAAHVLRALATLVTPPGITGQS